MSRRTTYPHLPRHPLIVCASLVENPMNLGALCRTAEAFRLEALVLKDLRIAQDRTFQRLTAATDRWQPLGACGVEALPTWLAQQRQQGYAIVGLSVAGEAQLLPQTPLPEKLVLLLGRELTGIPDAILALCDLRLTIPQYGMVESLNVQTAAAIAIYEYIRQWGMNPAPLQ
jgi:tRNA G18 (ribose-2'-O)-methylase SpoU